MGSASRTDRRFAEVLFAAERKQSRTSGARLNNLPGAESRCMRQLVFAVRLQAGRNNRQTNYSILTKMRRDVLGSIFLLETAHLNRPQQ